MNKLLIPAVLIGVLASGSAFAHRGWDDDDDGYRRPCRERERHVVVYQEPVAVYQAPPAVYVAPPPPVMYRERVVYREAPPAYGYQGYPPAPTYYRQAPDYAVAYSGNRVAGQAIGAVAGGVIGNQFGRGGGRMVSTAVGAVLGAVVGDHLSY